MLPVISDTDVSHYAPLFLIWGPYRAPFSITGFPIPNRFYASSIRNVQLAWHLKIACSGDPQADAPLNSIYKARGVSNGTLQVSPGAYGHKQDLDMCIKT